MSSIELIARAVCIVDDQLLLCKAKGSDWHYFPGGHIEFGEPARVALAREMQEEAGVIATISDFIGAAENAYERDGETLHEINLLFACSIPDGVVDSKEDHIIFSLVDPATLDPATVKPERMTQAVLQWLKDGKPFWVDITLP